jgi:acyl-CoA thioester hydrolase
MSQIYRYNIIVADDAEDLNGHVNNIEYLRWMQNAALLHSDSLGCTRATKAVGATWVVRTHRIEYFRPAFAGDDVSVLTWVANVRRVQSLRKYKVIRRKDNALLAEGLTDWIFVDAQSGKLRSIPRDIKALFAVVTEENEDEILADFI